MPERILALLCGAALDLLLGDPERFYHPVRLIGRYIAFAERTARRDSPPVKTLRRRAVWVGLSAVLLTALITQAALWLLGRFGTWPRFVGMSLIAWMCLSARSLAAEAEGVRRALEAGLDAGRKRLSRIVGRDTENLSEREVLCATIETVAENLSDGVISPMLWLAAGGPAAGMAFKAVSTLDSMIGYMDDEHRDVGWFSARMDDVCNFIPARITALLMCLCASPLGLDGRAALKIALRDHANHLSPNCGWPEAAAAGALGVRLGGTHTYAGRTVVKPTLGDDRRPPARGDIAQINRLMFASAGAMLVFIATACTLYNLFS